MAFSSFKYRKNKFKSALFVAVQVILIVLYFILPEALQFRFHTAIEFLGWLITAAGLFFILWATITLGRNISPFPTPLPQAQLVTQGIFRHIRHPIYTGLMVAFTGISVAQESLTKLLFLGVFMLFFFLKSSFEEQLLLERFPEYKNYRDRTGRFLPKCTGSRDKTADPV